VVVGYGEMKRGDLTSSIVTVKPEELTKSPTGQTMQALQGKVAGVQIVSTGNPGDEPTVRIRGIGTYKGKDTSPLYVVNGVLQDNIDFSEPF
jgi:outer membrane receptor for ferrienterochelin and colicin